MEITAACFATGCFADAGFRVRPPRGLAGVNMKSELTMRIVHVLAAAALSTAALAQAPSAAPGSRNAALVSAGTYSVDPNHTLVTWTLDHLGFSPYTGIFGDVTGTLTIDPKNLRAAKVDVRIPISKVVTASAGLTEHLLRAGKDGGKPDFFGARPEDARFVSTSVVATGQKAKIRGNLTLNGITRPVTLDAKFYGAGKAPAEMGGKDNLGFTATGTILRSQFGLGFGVPMVGDAVKLDISAAFQK
jgi:polyisoprenoid-binding protein YceI